MKESIFEKKIKKDYNLIKNYNKEKIIEEIELFFNNIKEYGYPDPDKLIKGGNIAKLSKINIDDYLINSLQIKDEIFNKASILWFIFAYWEERSEVSTDIIKTLYQEIENINDEYGISIVVLYILLSLLKKSIVKDNDLLGNIEFFIKNEYEKKKTNKNFIGIKLNKLYEEYFDNKRQ